MEKFQICTNGSLEVPKYIRFPKNLYTNILENCAISVYNLKITLVISLFETGFQKFFGFQFLTFTNSKNLQLIL